MSRFSKAYRVIVEPDYPKGYTAVVPAVPGLLAHGHTEQDAIDGLAQALQEHLEDLQERAQPLPNDSVQIAWDEDDEDAGARVLTIEV